MIKRFLFIAIFLLAILLASCASPISKYQTSATITDTNQIILQPSVTLAPLGTDTPELPWPTPQITATAIEVNVNSNDVLNRLFERMYSITACKTDLLTNYFGGLPAPVEVSTVRPFVEFIEVNVHSDPYMKLISEIADNDDRSYQAFVACENSENCHPKIFVRSYKIGKVYELNWSERMAWRPIEGIIWIDHSVLAFSQSDSPEMAQVIAVDVEKKDFVYYSVVDYDCPLSTPTP